MNKVWFQKKGWIFIPASWQGIIIVILFLAFSVNVFVVIDDRSHSVSDTLYGVFPFIVPAFLMYLWIASETSEQA